MSLLALIGAGAAGTVLDEPSGNPNSDHATIQTALDNSPLVVLAGDWSVNQTLVPRDGHSLVGVEPGSSTIHRSGFNGHLVAPETPSSTGLIANLTLDGHYDTNLSAGDNLHLDTDYPTSPNIYGGSYWHIERVHSLWAANDAFTCHSVEARFVHCLGLGSRNNNYSGGDSDQFYDHCTSGYAEKDGVSFAGALGFRLTGFKSWCAGWHSTRDTGVLGYNSYSGPYTNYRISGANLQMVNCESQDAGGAGAIIGTEAGRVQLHIDAAGAASTQPEGSSQQYAIGVDYARGAVFDITTGDGTSHVSPATGYAAWIGAQTFDCKIDIWTNPGHLEHRSIRSDSVIDSTNKVTLQGVPVT